MNKLVAQLKTACGLKRLQRGYFRMPIGKRRGGRNLAGGGGGGPAPGSGIRGAINLPGIDPFNGVFPYSDLMKSTNALWTATDAPNGMARTDPRLNSKHFPTAVPAGQSVTLLLWLGLTDLRTTIKIKPGNYKITWTPVAGAQVTISGDGISAVVPGTAGTATFTLASTSDSAFLTVTGIGSTGGGDDIKVFHVDHEAGLLGGDPLHPDFVSKITSWSFLRSIRFLDLQAANLSTVVNAADWTTMSYQSYCRGDRGCPPEIIGKIGAKFPSTVGIWTLMNRTATNAAMADYFQRIKAQEPAGTRPIYCEGINEAWNSGFPAYPNLGLFDYVGLDVRDINGAPSTAFNDRLTASYMHHAFRTWTACEAEFGIARTVRVVGVQTDFYAFMAAWIHYRDITGANLYGGATALTVVNPSAGRPDGEVAFTWYFYAYNGTTIKQLVKDDFGGQSDAFVKAAWLTDIDNNRTTQLVPSCNNYRARGFLGKFTTYEGSCHDFWDQNDTGSLVVTGTCNTGTNTINFSDVNWVFDGQLVTSPGATSVSGLSSPFYFYVRKTGTSLRCYATLSAYNGDTLNTGAGAATVIAGTFQFINQSFANRAASFVGIGNSGTNTIDFPLETTSWITDGDQLKAPNQSAHTGLPFPFYFYVRKTGTNSVRCYATLANYLADSGNTGVGALTVIAGVYLISNQTRFARMSDKVSSVFKGTTGQEIFQYVVDNNLKHPSVQAQAVNLFVAISSDKIGTHRFVKTFDAHNKGQFDAGDTPAVAYLKGLTGA